MATYIYMANHESGCQTFVVFWYLEMDLNFKTDYRPQSTTPATRAIFGSSYKTTLCAIFHWYVIISESNFIFSVNSTTTAFAPTKQLQDSMAYNNKIIKKYACNLLFC